MDENDFEGTLVLEKLAAIDRVDAFFAAVDSDDVERAVALMRQAKVDAPTIAVVVKMLRAGDGDH
jgi:Trk K+ transport system NAD-binding subunit